MESQVERAYCVYEPPVKRPLWVWGVAGVGVGAGFGGKEGTVSGQRTWRKPSNSSLLHIATVQCVKREEARQVPWKGRCS